MGKVLKETLTTPFNVVTHIGYITPENIVSLIESFFPSTLDILKIDIDGWDCDVLPRVLAVYHPAVVLVEFNQKFPPPLRIKLDYDPKYVSEKRSHIYGCSLAWMSVDIFGPRGYMLVQVLPPPSPPLTPSQAVAEKN